MKKEIFNFCIGDVPSWRLDWFQRAFTFTFLLYILHRFMHAGEWLTAESFRFTEETRHSYGASTLPPLPRSFVPAFFIMTVGSCLLAIIRKWERLALSLLTIIAFYIHFGDLASSFTLNKLYLVSFFILTVARIENGGEKKKISVWSIRILQLTLMFQYFFAGTCKAFHGDWFQNPYVLWTQVQGYYATGLCSWMLKTFPKWVWVIMADLALIFELTAPLLFSVKKLRPLAFTVGLGFQLIIALTMHLLGYFSAQMVCFYILFFLPLREWKSLYCKGG